VATSSGPHRLKKYQSQQGFENDFSAATTERPVVVHEGHTTNPISRREAMQRVTVLLGGVALIDGERVLAAMADAASATRPRTPLRRRCRQGVGTFTAADVAFLDEIAETILPETNTPGAKAARTGAFMALMVTDAYTPRHQQIFRDGMRRSMRRVNASTAPRSSRRGPSRDSRCCSGSTQNARPNWMHSTNCNAHARLSRRRHRPTRRFTISA
jgi:hypothetical protein